MVFAKTSSGISRPIYAAFASTISTLPLKKSRALSTVKQITVSPVSSFGPSGVSSVTFVLLVMSLSPFLVLFISRLKASIAAVRASVSPHQILAGSCASIML